MQKTAYEMRISDWSADVCSSDLLISWHQGSLNRATFTESLLGATRLSYMIALILSGAAFLTLAMGFTGLPRHLADWIDHLQLGRGGLIVALMVFYIVLGCFLDGISMVVQIGRAHV